MSTIYKIHPAIGVARVGPGNKPYDAPCVAGGLPTNGTSVPNVFRDGAGQLNPQSAVFQVYSYNSDDPNDPGTLVEIGKDGVNDINWTVWFANKKAAWFIFSGPNGEDGGYPANHGLRNKTITDDNARQKLVLDPGPRSVSCAASGSANFDLNRSDLEKLKPNPITSLGTLQASNNGELRVTGADGYAGQLTDGNPVINKTTGDFANNTGWFDTIADGPVNATVTVNDETIEVQVPAWVLSAPPKFAPQIVNLVTLRDTIYDVAVRKQSYNTNLYKDGAFQPDYKPNFEAEIKPILERPDLYQYVATLNFAAVSGHKGLPSSSSPSYIFSKIRPPNQQSNTAESGDDTANMPYLAGDNPFYGAPATPAVFLTLTQTQYFLLEQWSKGIVDNNPPTTLLPTLALDHGVLDNCVGGPFVPGIEITWICRKTEIYSEPFRIKHKPNLFQGELFYPKANTAYDFEQLFGNGVEPGDLSAFMAQPWQSDFNLCSSQASSKKAGALNKHGELVTTNLTLWWWAAQRPDWVMVLDPNNPGSYRQVPWIESSNPGDDKRIAFNDSDGQGMVDNWRDLGFVVDDGKGKYVLKYTNPKSQGDT